MEEFFQGREMFLNLNSNFSSQYICSLDSKKRIERKFHLMTVILITLITVVKFVSCFFWRYDYPSAGFVRAFYFTRALTTATSFFYSCSILPSFSFFLRTT
uniref:Uncharacterized protein n=1 Tax=Proboscia inermis TaxID=420281 RepID=A0A7S0GGK1_9STRA|mmetsp:Transcript_34765/g.34927  ORF Transcript_34765/g.34927 Transcript_34765/m.34927 type:complete len:101 (+) Transcript_34765:197-499(+)